MGKKFVVPAVCLLLWVFCMPARADYIKWVDFDVPYDALDQALELDVTSQGQEPELDWIELLAVAATRHGSGKVSPREVRAAAEELRSGKAPAAFLGELKKYYDYYYEAYSAVLGGLVGSYAIEKADGSWETAYGVKAFCPIAAGYGFRHCEDFGTTRTFGYARRHLGNDLMGTQGTPIAAVEGGTVEALGWNRYGGWRIGIRSFDRKRYYYYAHLQKDAPYAPGLREGDPVEAGDIIGFMGHTGYSDIENTENIETVHLHFGLELIFNECQKECDNEIWVDVYDIVELLRRHQVSVERQADGTYLRKYPYLDLDRQKLPDKTSE